MGFRDFLLEHDGFTFGVVFKIRKMAKNTNLIPTAFLVGLMMTLLFFSRRATQSDVHALKGSVFVTVRNMTGLDGCDFLLETDEKIRYQPINLPHEFRTDGIRLEITFSKTKGVSTCMSGEMIFINDAVEIKKKK